MLILSGYWSQLFNFETLGCSVPKLSHLTNKISMLDTLATHIDIVASSNSISLILSSMLAHLLILEDSLTNIYPF